MVAARTTPICSTALLALSVLRSCVQVTCAQDYFHDEQRDGKLQMTAKDRFRYWERTYADPRSKDGKDWYGSWADFKKDVKGAPFRAADDILVVGCGNSNLPADLVGDGFSRVTGMDYSKKAIKLQKKRFPDMNWVRGDVRRMPRFKDRSFDVVIEKALIDGEGAFREWPLMFSEISRVLRPGGRFVSISLGKPDEMNTELFFNNKSYGWDVEFAVSYDDYWVYTMTKHGERGEL
eukprot:TRINITY_DN95991_c0_g1_i1.p1 TRINITY_DN95991_c0_g1~~TRINITY_DN95991_c0_g1_i1.p1  ORF type:complete len:235 (+),score=49.25 TRINITY_DN95991_c0_g1_i1:75-779(+)